MLKKSFIECGLLTVLVKRSLRNFYHQKIRAKDIGRVNKGIKSVRFISERSCERLKSENFY